MIENEVELLIERQVREWPFAAQQYEALRHTRCREVMVDGSLYRIQFNPARAVSSGAKMDKATLAQRPCFLCDPQRPSQQQAVAFGDDYQILVNPFPIFEKHLTLPTRKHTLQSIELRFADLLDVAEALPGYVVFYNGPYSGASAPDHAHFQAAGKGHLPLEQEWDEVECRPLHCMEGATLSYMNRALNPALRIDATNKASAVMLFERVLHTMETREGEVEPRLNLLTWRKGDQWVVWLFPRNRHRPDCYREEDELYRRMISPGCIDMAGLIIAARENDYNRLDAEELAQILREVSLDTAHFFQLIIQLKKNHE